MDRPDPGKHIGEEADIRLLVCIIGCYRLVGLSLRLFAGGGLWPLDFASLSEGGGSRRSPTRRLPEGVVPLPHTSARIR